MTEPLTTVILSSFNRPKLIRDALDSVIAQTWPSVECIVADDHSGEEVHAVFGEYCGKFLARGWSLTMVQPDKRPTPHERQFGQRCAVGINAAMKFARGKFVCFLPDDDFLTPNSIEVRARYLMEHPEVNVVYGRLESCAPYEKGKIIYGIHGRDERQRREDLDVWMPECCHARAFWSAEPVVRIANHCDHGQVIVRRVPNLPEWPEQATREWQFSGSVGERFDCEDAGWFYRLERARLGPFRSVPDVVVVKRYHALGHRSDPTVRE